MLQLQPLPAKLLRGPFPDVHMDRAISIFEIQFAGATTTTPLPVIQKEIQLAG